MFGLKNAGLAANCVDPDETPRSAASQFASKHCSGLSVRTHTVYMVVYIKPCVEQTTTCRCTKCSPSRWDLRKHISDKLEFIDIRIRSPHQSDTAGGRNLSEKLVIVLLNNFHQEVYFQISNIKKQIAKIQF